MTASLSLRWQSRAACRDADPELFFFEGDEQAPANAAQLEQARQVCSRCPVRVQCGEYALAAFEEHGVWGGMTERDRRLARRADQRAAARERRAAA